MLPLTLSFAVLDESAAAKEARLGLERLNWQLHRLPLSGPDFPLHPPCPTPTPRSSVTLVLSGMLGRKPPPVGRWRVTPPLTGPSRLSQCTGGRSCSLGESPGMPGWDHYPSGTAGLSWGSATAWKECMTQWLCDSFCILPGHQGRQILEKT